MPPLKRAPTIWAFAAHVTLTDLVAGYAGFRRARAGGMLPPLNHPEWWTHRAALSMVAARRGATGSVVNIKSVSALWAACVLALSGCGERPSDALDVRNAPMIKIDGSSTVFPIAEAVAEEFQRAGNRVR